MNIDLAALPDDVETLHRMIGELSTALDSERTEAQAEITRLREMVKVPPASSLWAALGAT